VSIPVVENLPQRNGTLGKIYHDVERTPVENLPQGGVLLPANLPEANTAQVRDKIGEIAGVSGKQHRSLRKIYLKPESVPVNLPEQNKGDARDKIGAVWGTA